jgi:hypothetical protein
VAPPVFKTGLAANIVAGGFDSLPPPPPFQKLEQIPTGEARPYLIYPSPSPSKRGRIESAAGGGDSVRAIAVPYRGLFSRILRLRSYFVASVGP